MQSGFTGGGGVPDFYGAGRSIATTMNNASQTPYHRSQLQGLFLDPTASQIARQSPNTLVGKRTLAEFQSHQQYQHHPTNQGLANANFLRSVKPRTYQHSSPISPLSLIEFSSPGSETSSTSSSSSASSQQQQRFGLPLLHKLRPQSISPALPVGPYVNAVQNRVVGGGLAVDSSDKKMMDHRLQELEKELLDDNDEEEGDAVSVITNTNSEWSETIQNLISPNQSQSQSQSQKPVSPSPTSSSSSSSSVASPASSTCSKQSLLEAASAISEGKPESAAEILTRLSQVSNPNQKPNSEQKVLEFTASALKSRVVPGENPPSVAELFSQEHAGSTQMLYELSPCFKLGFMAANLAILEATLAEQQSTSNNKHNNNKLHVIDFEIGEGGQYRNLLHLVAPVRPMMVKITTVAENGGEERLKLVRETLSQLAERLRVPLKFNVVSQKLGELTRESLGCEADEFLVVNFAFKLYRMPDESVSTENPRDELLRRVKGLGPRVVTLVEQELNTNTAPFMARFNETCAYYGVLLDSIESTVPRDNTDRVKAEEAVSRKLGNSVACEGRDRVERCEVFGKWRARMGMAGFALVQSSQSVAESIKARLSTGNRFDPRFTVKEENGGVCFGWMGRTLTVASAWR
ncbi:scarecrow-like protein 8 [Ziziphus jujuba]|uniref:Scarecrow-like protein 8 n=1 Tax=Ziziphus jujuba TaxID=326968 RepID=A0A6P3ZI58_ZIZJJ|nr:scarecrow-like protein 8 [Ziziphus jujuba]